MDLVVGRPPRPAAIAAFEPAGSGLVLPTVIRSSGLPCGP